MTDREKCPHCMGMGKDDGGPGSWTCFSCRGTGFKDDGWPHARRTAVIRDGKPMYEWDQYTPDGRFTRRYTEE